MYIDRSQLPLNRVNVLFHTFLLSVSICYADVLSISIYNALTSINPIELAQVGT